MRTSFTTRFGSVALVRKLWKDDGGALLATEWVVVATIMVLGLIPGLIAIRQGTLTELADFANATLSLNQSYSFSGQALVCGGCDRVDEQGTGDGQNNLGTTTSKVGGINNLPQGAVGAKQAVNDKAFAGANGIGVQDNTFTCRPIAKTAGSAFVDTCKSVQTKSTPATVCDAKTSPCD
jgi:hypothetical protein